MKKRGRPQNAFSQASRNLSVRCVITSFKPRAGSRFPVGPVPGYRTRRKAHALPIVRDEFRPAIPRRVARQHCPSPLHRHHQLKTIAASKEMIYHRTVNSLLTVCLTHRDNPKETLTHLVASGVHIRILIMDETNRHLDAFINHHQIPGLTPDSVKAELKAARDAFKSVLESISAIDATGTLKLRVLKKGLIVTQIARMDDRITAVQYLYHAVASRTPLLEVFGDKSALFRCYKDEFDSMWKLAENA